MNIIWLDSFKTDLFVYIQFLKRNNFTRETENNASSKNICCCFYDNIYAFFYACFGFYTVLEL